MKRNEIKEKEIEYLAREYKKNPPLFEKETFIDTPEFLKDFGIFIEGKENFPSGYLKLWPQDFVVEEISENGSIQNINVNALLGEKKDFSEKGKTTYATLVKCDLSTLEAVEEVSSLLNIDKNQINFAGIKDKDAITSQLISIRKLHIEEIKNLNSPYLFLKHAYSEKGVMEVGKLRGNKFTVLVRTNNNFRKEEFLSNVNGIKKEGFLNFFYLQRFGTPRLINFYWGLFILKGEYEKAVLSFLSSPGKRELPFFRQLRKSLGENFGNWQKIEEIIKPFPLIFQNENKVVSHLKKNPRDFTGALNQIPDQVKLWLFATASLLFNKQLSFCIKENKKIPGRIPLILSNKENDWSIYKNILVANGIKSIPFDNLKPFSFVQLKRREIKTKEKIEISDLKIIKEGVILSFSLPKAAYATTFLTHLFNLTSGVPPKDIADYPIDTKASLGQESLEETLNMFRDVIHPKTDDSIKDFSL